MKKQLFIKVITASFLFFIYKDAEAQNSPLSTLNGAWKMVSDNVNGHIILAKDQPLKIYVLSDGFWMWYGPDSTGNWNRGSAGTYEITNNIWKQKAVYSYDPDLIGTINWSRFEMKGDTLYMQNYVKLIYHGEDQTAGSPKREVKWIRYKD